MIKQRWLTLIILMNLTQCAPQKSPTVLKKEPMPANQTPTPIATATPSEMIATPKPAPSLSIDSPTKVIERYTEELRAMVGLNERKQKGKADPEKEKLIAEKVRQFFDFQSLAQFSLGDHWKTTAPPQREEFSKLFIGLVEDSYIKRSRDLVGNYDLTFGKEQVQGDNAKVTCLVKRNDADIEILYQLHKKPKDWMIYNIVLDNVDLIQNYQSQFNRIIKKSGFKELLDLMRKKLQNGQEEATL